MSILTDTAKVFRGDYLQCANFDCSNKLTEWELTRFKNSGFKNKYRFCIDCRRSINRVQKTACFKCGEPLKTVTKRICDNCLRQQKNEYRKEYYRKNQAKRRSAAKVTKILEMLKQGPQSNKEIAEKNKINQRSVRTYISLLRQNGYTVKCYSYYALEEKN